MFDPSLVQNDFIFEYGGSIRENLNEIIEDANACENSRYMKNHILDKI